MAGENVEKIRFTLNGKEITLREGERLGCENRKLKDLGSLWSKIDVNGNKKLDKEEFALAEKLNKLLNNNGQWNSVQMQALAEEFESSQQEIGDFLDLKLKEKAPKKLVEPKAEIKIEAPKLPAIDEEFEAKYEAKKAEMEAKKAEAERQAALEAKYSTEHSVSSGETLGVIARNVLIKQGVKPTKDAILALVDEICEINGIENANKIKVGQKIRIPVEVGNVAPKPKAKVPTADELMFQVGLDDRVKEKIADFASVKDTKSAGNFAKDVDPREAAYILKEMNFDGVDDSGNFAASYTSMELKKSPITEELYKNAVKLDLLAKMLDRAKELKVDLGGEYSVDSIKSMPIDEQKKVVAAIADKVSSVETAAMPDIVPGRYVSKDEQGRDDRVVLVTVDDDGLHFEHRDYTHNAEKSYRSIHKDLPFPGPGTFEQKDAKGNVIATHTVTRDGNGLKVTTKTLTKDGWTIETWDAFGGRNKAKKESFTNISVLEAEIADLKQLVKDLRLMPPNYVTQDPEAVQAKIEQKEADLAALKQAGYTGYNDAILAELRAGAPVKKEEPVGFKLDWMYEFNPTEVEPMKRDEAIKYAKEQLARIQAQIKTITDKLASLGVDSSDNDDSPARARGILADSKLVSELRGVLSQLQKFAEKYGKDILALQNAMYCDTMNVHDLSGKTQDINGLTKYGKRNDAGYPLDITITDKNSNDVYRFEYVKLGEDGMPIYTCKQRNRDGVYTNEYTLRANKNGHAELVQYEGQTNYGEGLKFSTFEDFIKRYEDDLAALKENPPKNWPQWYVDAEIKYLENFIAQKKAWYAPEQAKK